MLRRTRTTTPKSAQPSFTSGNLKINFAQRRVTVADREVKLTPTEYTLLQELALNAGKVLTHTHLLSKVWGAEYREEREYLHVFTRRLRAKIEPDPMNPRYIHNVSGVGYQFQTSE
ncbi:winged helix-turn-helix domain-containing protein [Chloroflexota bacterium]